MAQTTDTQSLPYRYLPEYPDNYAPGNLIARSIDGLGFRYYWATEGLRPKDLAFAPSDGARTSLQTLEHIYSLTQTILNVVEDKPNVRPAPDPELPFAELRAKTLHMLKQASEKVAGKTEKEVANLSITFQRENESYVYPVWNLLNGQLADALTHVGQVVSFRRSSGNPQPAGVDVFQGIKRE
jgi:hypothetical protein